MVYSFHRLLKYNIGGHMDGLTIILLAFLATTDILFLYLISKAYSAIDRLNRQLDQARRKKWFYDGWC